MRLDKFIATTTDFSRSEVKRWLKQNEVTVNGTITNNPAQHIDSSKDRICLFDKALEELKPRYFMLYKPQNLVCANSDSEHPTVIDLLNEPKKETLQIAGRLDKDTTGLVLITDNGQWNHRVTSPNSHCFKRYYVTLAKPLYTELIGQFSQGILLKSENKVTLPAELLIIDDYHAELAIQEGKYHQVKRMFAAVGNHVTALHRNSIGDISLDNSLQPGQYRALNSKEVNCFAN